MIKQISSLQSPLVKHWVRLREDSSYRHEQQNFIIEGIKPVREVPKAFITRLIASDKALLEEFFAPEAYVVTEGIMRKVSGVVSPEGILAEVKMPSDVSLTKCDHILAFDAISDPGNMGTLIRTAVAFGWQGICLLPGCCDIYNEKVLRAARGAHFKLSIAKLTVDQLHEMAAKNRWQTLLADIEGIAPERVSEAKKRLLVLGNEAHGASEEVVQFCKRVSLPMTEAMESLNVAVAGGILMYLLRKR